jgi:hypothetical protein
MDFQGSEENTNGQKGRKRKKCRRRREEETGRHAEKGLMERQRPQCRRLLSIL